MDEETERETKNNGFCGRSLKEPGGLHKRFRAQTIYYSVVQGGSTRGEVQRSSMIGCFATERFC